MDLPAKRKDNLVANPRPNHFFLGIFFQLITCLALLTGGIILLALRIPGWSLLFGLPMVQIGIVFLIFVFDHLANKKVGQESMQVVLCSVCGQPTLSPTWQNEKICDDCLKKIGKKLG